MSSKARATVVIPTFNGIEYLDELLAALDAQHDPASFEVLVIDSGSTDGTLERVREHAGTRLHEIPNAEFGHGRTRNLAARLATTEFVVFLTQDATPAHSGWLAEMLRPFDQIGEQLACVFGKQVPRPDCVPTIKRDVAGHFAGFGPDHHLAIQVAGSPLLTDQSVRDAMGFFSDVNSAVRRRVLVEEIPYEDVDYAEDQVFGRAVLAAGYLKAYAPLGSVLHSHSYAPMTYLRRMYDEFAGLAAATGAAVPITRRELLVGWIRPTLADWRYIRRDHSYRRRTKFKHVVQAPAYNVLRRIAIKVAATPDPSPRMRRLLSLEHRRRAES